MYQLEMDLLKGRASQRNPGRITENETMSVGRQLMLDSEGG